MIPIYRVHLQAINGISPIFTKINRQVKAANISISRLKSNVAGSSMGALVNKEINKGSLLRDRTIKAKVLLDTKVAVAQINSLTERLKNKMKNINFGQLGMKAALWAGGMGYAAAYPTRKFSEYEFAFKDVRKAVQQEAGQTAQGYERAMQKLHENMRNVEGATYEEMGKIVTESGKMGFGPSNVFDISRTIMKGAKALDFDAETAAYQVGRILAMTGRQGEAAPAAALDIMDKVAHLENRLAGVKAINVMNVWKRSADMFNQLNFDYEKQAGMSAFLTQSVERPQQAATFFLMMMNRFKKQEGKFGFYKRIQQGGLTGLKGVIDQIKTMSPERQIRTFGVQAMKLIDKLQNKKNMLRLDLAIDIAGQSEGAVDREWAIYIKTFKAKKDIFVKIWDNLMSTLGKSFAKEFLKLFDFFNPILKGMDSWMKKNKEITQGIVWSATGIIYLTGAVSLLAIGLWALTTPYAAVITRIKMFNSLIMASRIGMIAFWSVFSGLASYAVADFLLSFEPVKKVSWLIKSWLFDPLAKLTSLTTAAATAFGVFAAVVVASLAWIGTAFHLSGMSLVVTGMIALGAGTAFLVDWWRGKSPEETAIIESVKKKKEMAQQGYEKNQKIASAINPLTGKLGFDRSIYVDEKTGEYRKSSDDPRFDKKVLEALKKQDKEGKLAGSVDAFAEQQAREAYNQTLFAEILKQDQEAFRKKLEEIAELDADIKVYVKDSDGVAKKARVVATSKKKKLKNKEVNTTDSKWDLDDYRSYYRPI